MKLMNVHNYFLRAVRMLGRQEDIDLERELHVIYRMFLEGLACLIKLKGSKYLQPQFLFLAV